MLAPIAMACKGTAWSQVKLIEAGKLTDPEQGVEVLLKALSSWDEAAELQTYERFEKAIYKVMQKNDESTMSFVNRLAVAFHELGDKVTVKELQAFILLRQSSLTSGDKRKVITLSGGTMEVNKIEQSMRTLSTKILTSGSEMKKRVYPANYVEAEDADDAFFAEDGPDEEGLFTQLAEEGDEDALFVSEYEGQILDYIQEMPEMAECFSACAVPHRDSNNEACTDNAIAALSSFKGAMDFKGKTVMGVGVPVGKGGFRFDGRRLHATLPWSGQRDVVVAYMLLYIYLSSPPSPRPPLAAASHSPWRDGGIRAALSYSPGKIDERVASGSARQVPAKGEGSIAAPRVKYSARQVPIPSYTRSRYIRLRASGNSARQVPPARDMAYSGRD